MNDPSDRSEERQIATERETIRRWADEHAAAPVRHPDEPDRFRIVPESESTEMHEPVEWDEFFGRLDDGDMVVIYHGADATDPFEVTHQDEILARGGIDSEELKDRLIEGETVTTEVTETTVVETVVVEEATIESELVDTEVVDETIVDVELQRRECASCTLVDRGAGDYQGEGDVGGEATGLDEGTTPDRNWFDSGRYFDSVGRGDPTETEMAAIESTDDVPFYVELDVEEAWSVTREFTERFTIESRVAETGVIETDTVEDREIDIEGLQRTIAESDLLDVDMSPDEVLMECEVESEFSEDDRIHTHFTRERLVEDEVIDRKRLHADVTGGEVVSMEAIHTQDLITEAAGGMADPTEGAAEAGEGEPVAETDRIALSEDEIGKTVVDATGDEIGMVTDVTDGGDAMYVDAHPGITERIKAALDWGDVDEDDVPVEVGQIQRITDEQVELKGSDHLESGEESR